MSAETMTHSKDLRRECAFGCKQRVKQPEPGLDWSFVRGYGMVGRTGRGDSYLAALDTRFIL